MKIEVLANKYVVYVLYLLLFFSFMTNLRACKTNKELNSLKKEVSLLKNEVDTLTNSVFTKKEMDVRLRIEGYEISKRMLYDQNAIVRTIIRPDDRMIEYDNKIKELQEK